MQLLSLDVLQALPLDGFELTLLRQLVLLEHLE
jgi:hypothetical protein